MFVFLQKTKSPVQEQQGNTTNEVQSPQSLNELYTSATALYDEAATLANTDMKKSAELFEEAITLFRKTKERASQEDPRYSDPSQQMENKCKSILYQLYDNLGKVDYNNNNLKKAVNYLSKALEYGCQSSISTLFLARAYRRLAYKAENAGAPKEAFELYQKALTVFKLAKQKDEIVHEFGTHEKESTNDGISLCDYKINELSTKLNISNYTKK